ncbi:MAG: MgtC/SapB family protein [Eubacteriales bacterium]|nr:MgtC/SapB family protein [Eubacteriales bacterium]
MEQYSMELMYAARLLLSGFCGLLIGFERQNHIRAQHRESAGMRTHMLVCVASAAMMLISKYGFMDVLLYGDNVRVDVSRVAAGIVSGVSFLGAGTIFIRRDSIKGLTTAAGVWAAAAVGMAVGCGMYGTGIVLTVLVLLIQEMSRIHLYQQEGDLNTVIVVLTGTEINAREILDWFRSANMDIQNVTSDKTDHGNLRLTMRVWMRRREDKEMLLDLQSEMACVKSVEF